MEFFTTSLLNVFKSINHIRASVVHYELCVNGMMMRLKNALDNKRQAVQSTAVQATSLQFKAQRM